MHSGIPRQVDRGEFLDAVNDYALSAKGLSEIEFQCCYAIIAYLSTHQDAENYPVTLFSAAIKKADTVLIDLLLKIPSLVNAPDENDLTPLMCSILQGDERTAIKLIEDPLIDVNLRNKQNMTALAYAIEKGQPYIAASLIAKGAAFDADKICENIENKLAKLALQERNNEMLTQSQNLETILLMFKYRMPLLEASQRSQAKWADDLSEYRKKYPEPRRPFKYLNGEFGTGVAYVEMGRVEVPKAESKVDIAANNFELGGMPNSDVNLSPQWPLAPIMIPSDTSGTNENKTAPSPVVMPPYGIINRTDTEYNKIYPKPVPYVPQTSLREAFNKQMELEKKEKAAALAPLPPALAVSSASTVSFVSFGFGALSPNPSTSSFVSSFSSFGGEASPSPGGFGFGFGGDSLAPPLPLTPAASACSSYSFSSSVVRQRPAPVVPMEQPFFENRNPLSPSPWVANSDDMPSPSSTSSTLFGRRNNSQNASSSDLTKMTEGPVKPPRSGQSSGN